MNSQKTDDFVYEFVFSLNLIRNGLALNRQFANPIYQNIMSGPVSLTIGPSAYMNFNP